MNGMCGNSVLNDRLKWPRIRSNIHLYEVGLMCNLCLSARQFLLPSFCRTEIISFWCKFRLLPGAAQTCARLCRNNANTSELPHVQRVMSLHDCKQTMAHAIEKSFRRYQFIGVQCDGVSPVIINLSSTWCGKIRNATQIQLISAASPCELHFFHHEVGGRRHLNSIGRWYTNVLKYLTIRIKCTFDCKYFQFDQQFGTRTNSPAKKSRRKKNASERDGHRTWDTITMHMSSVRVRRSSTSSKIKTDITFQFAINKYLLFAHRHHK